MKFIPLFALLAVFSLFCCGCSTPQYTPLDYPYRQLRFGSGGGFTGEVNEYALLDNGQLFSKPGRDTVFTPLFDYEPVFVAASQHPLADKAFVEAEDFRGETLITYPVDRARLDVFSQLLTPAKVEPAAVRQVELTAVILLLVASNRGVAVLPDWVVRQVRLSSDYVTRPLTRDGITRRLYAATRDGDAGKPYMAHLIRLARQEAVKLQRG